MAAQFYNLEEAARALGMSPEELKAKAQHREIRAFMDSGSWQFRVNDVDELARRRGMGSDPEFSLSDLDMPSQQKPSGESASEELDILSEFQLGVARPDLGPKSMDLPASGGSDHEVLLDDLSVPPSLTGSSSTILGMGSGGKVPSDSDVRLMPSGPLGSSDSDVQLSGEIPSLPSDSDVSLASGEFGSSDASLVDEGSRRDQTMSDVSAVDDDRYQTMSDVSLADESRYQTMSDVSPIDEGSSSGSLSDVRLADPPRDQTMSDVSVVDDDRYQTMSDVSPIDESRYGTMSDVTPLDDSGSSSGLGDEFGTSDLSGETMLRPSPVTGSSDEVKASADAPPEDSDSDFELTPSSVIDALEPESGSDFELTAVDASDEDFEATPLRPSDSDVTGAEPSAQGIGLGKPSDSGINLQSVGGLMGGADSIELAPLDDEGEARSARPGTKPQNKPAAKPGAKPAAAKLDASSATALPTKAEKNIFEDTDFEVDAIDPSHDDQTVQLEIASDVDLPDSDSRSEVFPIDDEEVDSNAATALGPALAEEESGSGTSGEVTTGRWDEEEAAAPAPSSPSRAVAMPMARGGDAGPGPEWGGLWVGFLGVSTFLVLGLALVTLDVVRNLHNFQGPTPVASGLVNGIAGLFGG